MEKNGLSVGELLSEDYKGLRKSLHGEEIFLGNTLREIARDCWPYGDDIGYMEYESVILVELGENKTSTEKIWALGLGKKTGSYPGDIYENDILIIEITPGQQGPEKISETIRKNKYFQNSLIIGMNNGSLRAGKGDLGRKLAELLNKSNVGNYIAQKAEIDHGYVTLDLRPIVKSPMRYKEEAVDFLLQKMIQVLTNG